MRLVTPPVIRISFPLPEVSLDDLRRVFPGVYTDGVHLGAYDEAELHRFAGRIGLQRRWFQPRRYPHYDLMGRMLAKALRAGASRVSKREFIRRARAAAARKDGED